MKKFVDEARLNKIAKLARIEVRPEEVQKYLDMINNDLELLEALDGVNTDGIEPLTNPYDMELRQYPDILSDGNKVDELMKCAPDKLYNYFVVPKVVENK